MTCQLQAKPQNDKSQLRHLNGRLPFKDDFHLTKIKNVVVIIILKHPFFFFFTDQSALGDFLNLLIKFPIFMIVMSI